MTHSSTDARWIERRLLELAHTTDAKLTAPALAYFAPCSLDDAQRVLDDLTARDRLIMEVEDDGSIVYQLLGRQRLAPPSARPQPHGEVPPAHALRPEVQVPPFAQTRALVPVPRTSLAVSPFLAALLSVAIPGAGHLYAGRVGAALLWFVVVGMGYALLFPGLVLHLFNIASAAAAAHRTNAELTRLQLTAGGAP